MTPGETVPPTMDVEAEGRAAEERAAKQQENEEVIRVIKDRLERAEERNADHIKEMEDIKRLYRGQAKDDVREGRTSPGKTQANVGNLEMYRCLKSTTSAKGAIAFSDDPFFVLYDPELSDQSNIGMYHTKQLLDNGHEHMGFRTNMTDAIRSGETYGNVVLEVGWKKQMRWKGSLTPATVAPVTDPITGMPVTDEMGQPLTQETPAEMKWSEVVDYQRPYVRIVPLWRFYKDPASTRIDDARWVMEHAKLTREDIDAWIAFARESGMETQDLDDETAPSDGESAIGEVGETVSRSIQKGAGTKPEVKGVYDAIIYWGLHPKKKDPREEYSANPDTRFYLIIIVEGKTKIVDGVNPYWHGKLPYVEWKQDPEEETGDALGKGKLLKNTQILVNDSESLMQDMTKFGLYRVWRRSGGMVSGRTNVVRIFPGRILDDDTDGVLTPVPMDTAPFKLAQAMQSGRIENMRGASGGTSNMQAMQTGGTVGEAVIAKTEAARGLTEEAIAFGDQILRPLLEMELELYNQFLPEDTVTTSMVPMQGKMIAVPVAKSELRLTSTKVRLKLATDLDNRKSMTRNLNQNLAQIASFVQTVAAASPAAASGAVTALLPSVVQIIQKQLTINGMNPATVPSELVTQIVQQMEQEKAMQAQAQLAAQPAGQPQPVGGEPPPEGTPENVQPMA